MAEKRVERSLGGNVAGGSGGVQWRGQRAGPTGAGSKKAKKEPAPDPMAEIEKLRAEFEQRLADQEAAAKTREEALRKEQAAAMEAARDEADKRMAVDRNERQAEVLRLQKALEEAAAREDAREKNAPPAVGASMAGVSLYGYVQADYQVRQSSEDQLDPASGQPLNQDRFLIRRARLGVTMDRQYGEGRLEIDGNTVNGPALRLFDAEASAKWPGRGRGRPARGHGNHRSVQDSLWARGAAGRSPAVLHGAKHGSAGAVSWRGRPGRAGGRWLALRPLRPCRDERPAAGGQCFAGLDPNHQKDILGRVGVEHSLGKIDFAGGVSGLRGTGFHPGTTATKPTLQWNDSDENGSIGTGEVTGVPGLAAGASSNFTRFAFGADLAHPRVCHTNSRPAWRPNSIWPMTWIARSFPLIPRQPRAGASASLATTLALIQEFGRWQLGVRYDYYNPIRIRTRTPRAARSRLT